jgi:hypothetical protein
MQWPAGGGEVKHGQYQNTGERRQGGGHGHTYCHDKSDGDQRRHAWRQNVPNRHVLKGKDGVGGGGDPACQCPGHPIDEVAGRMPGQMAKQVAAQVAGDRNEGVARDPARNAPQHVVRRNQCREEEEAQPGVSGMAADVKSSRQGIDENLHAVLRAH